MKINSIDYSLNNLNTTIENDLKHVEANEQLKQRIINSAYINNFESAPKFSFKKYFPAILGSVCAIVILIIGISSSNFHEKNDTAINSSPRLFNAITAGKNNTISTKNNSQVPSIGIYGNSEFVYEPRWIGSIENYPYVEYDNVQYRLLSDSNNNDTNIADKGMKEIIIEKLNDYNSELKNAGIVQNTKFYYSENLPCLLVAKTLNKTYYFQRFSITMLDKNILCKNILNDVKSVYYSKLGLIDDIESAKNFVSYVLENTVPNDTNVSEYTDYILININNIFSLQIGVKNDICIANGCFKLTNLDNTFEHYIEN